MVECGRAVIASGSVTAMPILFFPTSRARILMLCVFVTLYLIFVLSNQQPIASRRSCYPDLQFPALRYRKPFRDPVKSGSVEVRVSHLRSFQTRAVSTESWLDRDTSRGSHP